MSDLKKRWWLLGGTLAVAFVILGFFGREVYRQAPPIPERVVTSDGVVLLTRDDILTGQQVWQSTGGQQLDAHTALFGVYGLLSLGLVLLVARFLTGARAWREWPIAVAFWGTNIGLALMVVLSLLPIGLAQAWASMEHGLWFARSADFLQQPWLQSLRWLRIVGDTVFIGGTAALALFMLGLWTGWSYEPEPAAARDRPGVRISDAVAS